MLGGEMQMSICMSHEAIRQKMSKRLKSEK